MLMKVQEGRVRVFDPRGIILNDVAPVAPRVRKLAGRRLGILDNSKWNANKLLRGAATALSADIEFSAVNYYVKHSFSKDAYPELIERILAHLDRAEPAATPFAPRAPPPSALI